jgi:hypothetical protein
MLLYQHGSSGQPASAGSSGCLACVLPPCDVRPRASALCRKLSLSRKLPCGKCNGTGSKSGRRDECGTCHGTGVQVMIRPIGPGMVQQIQQPCRDCNGNGTCAKPSKRRKGLVRGYKQCACIELVPNVTCTDRRPGLAHQQLVFLSQISSLMLVISCLAHSHCFQHRRGSGLLQA